MWCASLGDTSREMASTQQLTRIWPCSCKKQLKYFCSWNLIPPCSFFSWYCMLVPWQGAFLLHGRSVFWDSFIVQHSGLYGGEQPSAVLYLTLVKLALHGKHANVKKLSHFIHTLGVVLSAAITTFSQGAG